MADCVICGEWLPDSVAAGLALEKLPPVCSVKCGREYVAHAAAAGLDADN